MDKLRPTFVLMYCLVFITLSGCTGEKSPSVITKHEVLYPNIRKKYLYQSVIRLANMKGDPAFNELIKAVRKIIIYLPPTNDSTYQITDVRDGMAAEGYEELVDVRTANASRVSLWVKESKSQSTYLGLLDTKAENMIFEIDGQLNLKYLTSLKFADQSSLMELLN